MRPRMWNASFSLPGNLDEIFQLLENGKAPKAPVEHALPLDIFEHADRFEVWLDVPGINREDVKLSLEGETLKIQGERPAQAVTEESSQKFRRTERWTGSFSRSLTLPASIDATRIEAKLQDGVLRLTLPKLDQVKSRTIPING